MEIKVPFYSITNIFLPGLILIGSSALLFLDEVKELAKAITSLDNVGLEVLITVSLFAIAYEIGYILFRFGAIVIKPLLKLMFREVEYSDFIKAEKTSEKAYNKLEMLSREYGYARTQITLFIALAILTGIQMQWWIMICCIICVVLFLITVRGHMKKTQDAVKQYLTTNSGESEVVSNE